MNSKIVFFDIDGTLYMHDIGVPKSAISAIEKLLENNHIPILCTGRAKASIPQKLIDIGFQGIIAAAGADVSFEDNQIHQVVDGTETANKLAPLLKEGNIRYLLEGPQYIYYDSTMDMNLDIYTESLVKIIGKDKFKPVNEGEIVFNKVSAIVTKESVISPAIKEKFDIIAHSEIPVVEMVPKGYNKAIGIEMILDFLGADKKDTYAFGDSNNDLEMLNFVEYGIAMGNAYPDVLAKSKYKTKSIYEDGIYYGLKEFGLI